MYTSACVPMNATHRVRTVFWVVLSAIYLLLCLLFTYAKEVMSSSALVS